MSDLRGNWITSYLPTNPSVGPSGPPSGQFLGTFQGIVQTINQQAMALNQHTAALGSIAGLTPTQFPQMTLSTVAPPAPPASGAILYVDNTTGQLMVVLANGTRVQLS